MLWSTVAVALYFCLWALIHSLTASLAVKRWVRRTVGPAHARWYRVAFNAVAGITFLPMLAMVLWLPDRVLYTIPLPWRWVSLGGQMLAFIALLWTGLQTDVLRFAGLTQLLSPDAAVRETLQVRGFYCYVRHPLYLFSLVIIWLIPRMTATLLALFSLMTLYFYVGSILEERKLLLEFGSPYARYRDRVPRFLPRLTPREPIDMPRRNATP